MAYRFKGNLSSKTAKHFSYFILKPYDNKKEESKDKEIRTNITITLENQVGYFNFSAKLVPDYKFNSQNDSQNFPTIC